MQIIIIYLFILGLIFGSFVLAMVDRMKSGKDWVRGRSECDSCRKKLQAADLIPLVSWISTGGKCRYCGARLSRAYPLVEIAMGVAFTLSYVFWPFELDSINSITVFIIWMGATILMTGLFIYDMRWFTLPNKLVKPLIVLGLLWAVLDISSQGISVSIIFGYILAIAVGAGIFWLIYMVSNGKLIGDGDIRLGVAIGLFTGNPFEAWLTIFLASVIGILASIPVIARTKKSKRLRLKIPFGPVLIIALYITVLFGVKMIDWYKENLLHL